MPTSSSLAFVDPQAVPQPEDGAIKMFTDVHRFLMQRHADIEWLREQHGRKNTMRQQAIAECFQSLEHDSAERAAHISRFGEEMQRLTMRKAETLSKEIAEFEVRRGDKATAEAVMDRRKSQFQIDRLTHELESIRSGLLHVADAMELMGASLSHDFSTGT
eukprot:TRINITY_DN35499_c0_g1_i1.p1 TRINITY_DN35499_c0_g1~~TRINITY_DN35499_c0_g1_i1.p1  ORF type:complete len:181 (-),score=39.15 TRINITY_DN35499_c0_g1_i1:337-819(-)